MRLGLLSLLLACSLTPLGTGAVFAEADDFTRDENVSVRGRPRADYDAIGIPLGTFLLFPKTTIVGEYDTNIFALHDNVESDYLVHLRPEMVLRSQWPNDELTLHARGSFNRYSDHDSENTDEYTFGADAKIVVLHSSNVSAGVEYQHEALSRQATLAPRNSENPIEYDHTAAHIAAAHVFNRLRLTGRLNWTSTDFDNGRTPSGATVFEDFLDLDTTSETLRADYAISPGTAIFVSGTHTERNYDLAPPAVLLDRDSNGLEITGGVNFQVTSLISGEVGVGYLTTHYPLIDNQDVHRLALHASIEWYPTQLTTVNLKLDRAVSESPIATSSGYVDTTARLQVDHELRRNFILTAVGQYSDYNHQGIDRRDRIWTAGVSGTYLLNRVVGIALAVTHDDETSTGHDRFIDYEVNRVSLSLVLQR